MQWRNHDFFSRPWSWKKSRDYVTLYLNFKTKTKTKTLKFFQDQEQDQA